MDKLKLTQIKKLCKSRGIKLSGSNKKELVGKLKMYFGCVKIQRFLRSRWIENDCPISLEKVVYPCYTYKPMCGNRKFIYYNLGPLVEYLTVSGDFRDPHTREEYNEAHIKKLEEYRKGVFKGKNLYKLSKNENYYKTKKRREDGIEVMERCLDEIVYSIRQTMEIPQNNSPSLELTSYHFPNFHRYFKSLWIKSQESSKYVLKNTLSQIGSGNDPNNVKDYILQFIYTMETTYFP